MIRFMLSAFAIAGFAVGMALLTRPAECAWCPSYTCFARCSSSCACVTMGGESGGTCMSFEAIPDGATVLP